MRTIALLAATAMLFCTPLGLALAQNAPDSGTPAAPATTAAPAAPAAPAPAPAAQTPPANAAAPAAESANPPAANPPATNAPTTATDNTPKDNTTKTKKKKAAGTTRRREIEKSIDTGTVPSRYRSSVPKEYQQYIPFSKD